MTLLETQNMKRKNTFMDYEIGYANHGYLVYDATGYTVFRAPTLEECETWIEAQEPECPDLPGEEF